MGVIGYVLLWWVSAQKSNSPFTSILPHLFIDGDDEDDGVVVVVDLYYEAILKNIGRLQQMITTLY